jgi:flagellin-like protein
MELQNFKALIKNDDAVSPVIGVVLMVAITVILAAVIGSFVVGLGSEASATPQASFEFDYDGSGNVAITHDGGDTLQAANIKIVESDGSVTDVTSPTEISAGDEFANIAYSGDTIRVVYNNPNNDKSATLASSTTP